MSTPEKFTAYPAVFCQCGCGQRTAMATRNRRWNIQGRPTRFLHGHRQGIRAHGLCETPEYRAWDHIIQRCTNPKCKVWKHYGGRGITVCTEWRDNFEAFLTYVGKRPSPKHSIDRIDNNGNYEPGNVRWATRKEQRRNMRNNTLITINGETKCMQDWAEHLGVRYQTIQYGLRKNSLERLYEKRCAER